MFNHRLAALFTQLRGVVGDDHVQRFDANDECAGEATFASDVQVLGAVQPANALEVAAVVRACQRHQVPFYAISTGRNWGYGSALPATNGLRIELARMTRIVEFNDQLGYVRVEPGVTSAQLYAFLQAQGGRFWMDATGSSPDDR